MEVKTDSSPLEPLWLFLCGGADVWLVLPASDLMERSLGVNTFQVTKKLVDRVISVRYCFLTVLHKYSAVLQLRSALQWLPNHTAVSGFYQLK